MSEDWRQILNLARTAINQQDPHLALQHLKGIERSVEDLAGTPIWAEHRLTLAEAYGALGDEAAASFFDEALDRLGNLSERQPALEARANEHYADYLRRFPRRLSKSRELYAAAKGFATRMCKEDSARIQLKIIRTDLETDKDPELENFQTLKRVASRLHATYQTQLAAWVQHLGQRDRAIRGLKAARSKSRASEQHFVDLIISVRESPE